MRNHPSLTVRTLARPATFHQPSQSLAPHVSLDDPAPVVMTDLKQVTAVTIDPEASIEHAMRVMVRRNVRLLFVVNVDNEIVGLITSTDLLGEKPTQHIHERGWRRSDIQVRDIMTPHERCEVIAFEDVLSSKVRNVLATLQHSRRQHALVADSDAAGNTMVRGIFAAFQLARQLGRDVHTSEVAHSFAEIEAALARS
jgi:CBS-domain-containing membrane protein